jgi:hypothetical protein
VGDVARMQRCVQAQIDIMERLVKLDSANETWRRHYKMALAIWDQVKRLRPGDRFTLEKN